MADHYQELPKYQKMNRVRSRTVPGKCHPKCHLQSSHKVYILEANSNQVRIYRNLLRRTETCKCTDRFLLHSLPYVSQDRMHKLKYGSQPFHFNQTFFVWENKNFKINWNENDCWKNAPTRLKLQCVQG